MSVLTFKRGIHPPDNKHFTNSKPIVTIEPDEGTEMVYALLQHLGAPCKPIVNIGDRVLVNQKIADSDAFVSSPIHSSVSGTVKAFSKTFTPNGNTCDSIIVENDGKYEEIEVTDKRAPENLTNAEILEKIREGGIVGLGGAGFPTHIKLNPPKDKKIDTILINSAECEPYLTTDYRVMMDDADSLIEGLKVILRLFPGAKGIIGIENNKMDAIEKLEKMTADIENISIATLQTKYPQGSEKQLIYSIVKREVPSGGLPADVGVIVDNTDTARAIHRVVNLNRPLKRRIMTISGDAVKNPGNYMVRIGMPYDLLFEKIGGFTEDPYKIISGGPMMGVAMFDLKAPLIKVSAAVLAFTEKTGKLPPERNCIRCGKCVTYCPMGLMPLELNQNAIHYEKDLFEINSGLDCIECGSCSYVCPSKRHLAQSIRATKRDILANRKK